MDVPEIGIDEMEDRLAAGAVVLDVRQPDEYLQGHVPGALLIPMDEIPERIEEVPEGDLLVICGSGGRSRRVAEFLWKQGLEATNIGGGTVAWVESGRPVQMGSDPR